MAGTNDHQIRAQRTWRLVARQHGMVSRAQLLALGYSRAAISHRLAKGRLFAVTRGVYAAGRPDVSRPGQMMAAVLASGDGSVISHEAAAELWRLRRRERGPIDVSVARPSRARRSGLVVHRRTFLTRDVVTRCEGVPVTGVPLTLVDLAATVSTRHLEAAVNMADSLDLLDPAGVRRALSRFPHIPGVTHLRRLLDAHSFRLTDSELERMFNRLVGRASLPAPRTQRFVSGHRVDFVWPEIGLVVETDSLRYHRTPMQQRRDAERDHAHLLAGVESVRFTHHQVAYAKPHVIRTLEAAAARARGDGHSCSLKGAQLTNDARAGRPVRGVGQSGG